MKIDAVSFDMDGTLIRNTDSVRYLCMLNNNLDELERIHRREDDKNISWIEADYLKAKLIKGLDVAEVKNNFVKSIRLIKNIDRVLLHLREQQIESVLITSGPTQIVDILGEKFGFDAVYGSEYEVLNNKFTGRILTHLGSAGKLDCLKEYCTKSGINLKRCVAIGDSESDIAVFKECGKSIAINYSDALRGMASEYIITDDLFDIAGILKSWLAE
ncbi:MAG: HAD-IB family phosphatase [FCB group bacterium]|nr:HAD-IB family phosphatase [FCB group bacterium]